MTFADKLELAMLRETEARLKRLSESTPKPINIDLGDLRLALDLAFLHGSHFALRNQVEDMSNEPTR
jgi:hypothetical protein